MPRKIDLPDKVNRLRSFLRRENRRPSYQEMLPLLGYRSKHAAHRATRHLLEHGYLQQNAGHRLIP